MTPVATSNRLLQRLLLEELTRKRSAGDYERYVESFRRAAVDPNPHQLEAVAFALRRMDEGGVLLCDEVGLGKTIETGLLLTQLRAEGKVQILIIVPLPLARQWQVELKDLFGLDAKVVGSHQPPAQDYRGIHIAGREFVGSPRWYEVVRSWGPWDAVVIDEAHELMSSLYRRFKFNDGSYETNLRKGACRRAAMIREVMADAPAIILTATPLQNSLYELWALVHLVDRSQVVLGRFNEFAGLFCLAKGIGVRPELEVELRRRLGAVVCRTLRSEAQPYLSTPFTARHCETINFHMQAAERELYAAVTEWMAGPSVVYRPRHRSVIELGMRRRMGSSIHALAASLSHTRRRLEEDQDGWWNEDENVTTPQIESSLRELKRLEGLARRALERPSQKLEKLLDLVHRVEQKALEYVASDKVVVFTESRKTLEAIVAYLKQQGLEGQVTAFSGQNEGPEAEAALRRWRDEVGQFLDPGNLPEPASAIRAALIHEFKTRTRVLVATEAGAKGLNLQFCNCLVNFDLPWNPQRIEQRIGRVHRYGQLHDVVIVNFINLDNEGEDRVYDILREKLQLFEGVLGASDAILGLTASVLNFEERVLDLFSRCRTAEARRREFERLEKEVDDELRRLRQQRMQASRDVISRLDSDVQARLKLGAEAIPGALSRRDETLLHILDLDSPVERLGSDQGRLHFVWRGHRYHLGAPSPSAEHGEPLYLDHSLFQQLSQTIYRSTPTQTYELTGPPGRWWIYKVHIEGLEQQEQLLVLGPEGMAGLQATLQADIAITPSSRAWSDSPGLDDAMDELQSHLEEAQENRWNALQQQLLNRREDVRRLFDREEQRLLLSLQTAQRKQRSARDAGQSSQGQGAVTRAQRLLDELRAQRSEQIAKAHQEVDARLAELTRRRFVEVRAVPLFSLVRGGP